MDEKAWDLLTDRLDRMENKIDELVRFKYWFIGIGAAVSCFVSGIVTFLNR